MDFNFFMPVQVYSGKNCLRSHADSLRQFGKRCLIITSRHAAKASGALDDTIAVLTQCGISYTVFSEIGENPLLSLCQAAAHTAQTGFSEGIADFIIGIGGGSVMDASKAAAWLASNTPDDREGLMSGQLKNPPLPLVLIGTTSGTGSEVSATAVLTMDSTRRKQSITHPYCYARLVFADPHYTHSLSRSTTVSTALDAFSHTAEGWFSPSCGDVITSFGEKALFLVSEGLSRLAEQESLPDETLREKLYYGSLWAGMVLNTTGTAFPHPLGYILTEEYGIPHGMACAVFLPAFLERAETFEPERAARLFALCGGREHLYAVLKKLTEYHVEMTDDQIASYRSRWINKKNFQRTPGGFTPDDAAALFCRLFTDCKKD